MRQSNSWSPIEKAMQSVVEVFTPEGTGAGFVISERGFVLTNKHVTGMADCFTIRLFDGRISSASFEAATPEADLALLKVDLSPVTVLNVCYSVFPRQGETVYALGHPHGLGFTVTKGIVSSSDRVICGVHYVQTDVAMNPGNSGGPLLNGHGQLMGINTMILSTAQGIGFATALSHVHDFLKSKGHT